MRLKSEVWVKAYLRRCAVGGVAAAVVRRGDSDAGAICIKVNLLDGRAAVYEPAPAGLASPVDERRWQACFEADAVPEDEADAYLQRQAASDPDLWIVEIEDRSGRHFLDDWLGATVGPSVFPPGPPR
jgi:hypothetical protein